MTNSKNWMPRYWAFPVIQCTRTAPGSKLPALKNGIEGIQFPLAADLTRQVARDYGVLVEEEGIPLRGLFIIDPEGILQYSVVHNMNIGRKRR